MTILPPDRGHLSTEARHHASEAMDALDALGCARLMIDDHRAVLDALDRALTDLARFIEALVPRLRDGGRLVYLGAGTSGRLGVLDASECPPTFNSDPGMIVGLIAGGDAALRRSSESLEDDPAGAREEFHRLELNERDTVLGIAAGGTTPFVLGGLDLAKRAHAMTGLLTCARQRALPPPCDHLIVLETGPEVLTGSTRLKAGSATKLALNIITTTAFVQMGKTYGNLMVDLRATNDKLRDRAMRILIELNPRLSRDNAAALLKEAGGELKSALVMARREVDLATAKRLLGEHNGRVRAVIDATAGTATPVSTPSPTGRGRG